MSARTVLNEAEKHGVKVTLNAAANSNPVFQSGRRLDGIGSAWRAVLSLRVAGKSVARGVRGWVRNRSSGDSPVRRTLVG
jgi:hypothetical protein